MNKEFISYEQALELKELGFREQTLAYYSKNFNPKGSYILIFASDSGSIIDWNEPDEENDYTYASAPLYQQAFRWFREKYNLYHEIIFSARDKKWVCQTSDCIGFELLGWYQTYEEAELACLKKLIEIIKTK